MNPELIAILGVGVSLAAIVVSGQRSLRTELRSGLAEASAERRAIRTELRSGLAEASAERRAIRTDLHALAERVARLEGAFPFLAARLPAPAAQPDGDLTA